MKHKINKELLNEAIDNLTNIALEYPYLDSENVSIWINDEVDVLGQKVLVKGIVTDLESGYIVVKIKNSPYSVVVPGKLLKVIGAEDGRENKKFFDEKLKDLFFYDYETDDVQDYEYVDG